MLEGTLEEMIDNGEEGQILREKRSAGNGTTSARAKICSRDVFIP